jgi:hypothetical protein
MALGAEDLRLLFSLCAQDRPLLLTFGRENLGLLHAFRGEDCGAAVALGTHLFLHRLLDGPWGIDRLELDPIDADSPLAGRLVEYAAQLGVDLIPRREGVLQRHSPDHVAQSRHRELLDPGDVVRDLVGRRLRVRDLVVDDGVDRDDEVVLCDDRLRRKGDDLLTQVDERQEPVDERDDESKACVESLVVAAESLDEPRPRLRDDPHCAEENDDDQDGDDPGNDETRHF